MTQHPRALRRLGWLRVLLLSSLLAVAAAAQPVELAFDPPAGSFGCDQTIDVAITVDAAAVDLRGFSLQIGYAASVVAPVSVTAGSLLVGAACDHWVSWLNPGSPGTLAIDGAALGCSVAGPGPIVVITFEGVVDGMSPLTCLDVRLRDGVNAALAHTCTPGELQFACPVATRATDWTTLKDHYR